MSDSEWVTKNTAASVSVFELDSILQLVVFRPLVSAEVIKGTQI